MDTHMQKSINTQINEEMFSAYLYLAIAQWSEAKSLKGFAHWFKKQAQEEMEHAMKFISHLNSRGVEVKLNSIATPSFTGKTALAALEASLAHEKHITKTITASFSLLQWFIDEQV
jgi:ferritin